MQPVNGLLLEILSLYPNDEATSTSPVVPHAATRIPALAWLTIRLQGIGL